MKPALPFLLCFAILLCGCATSRLGETGNLQAEYYGACYKPLVDLRKRVKEDDSPSPLGYVMGGLGGIFGAAIGALTLDPRNIVGGAVAGAQLGSGSSAYSKNQSIADDRQRLNAYKLAIDQEVRSFADIDKTVGESVACYKSAYADLKKTNAASGPRYQEIASGLRENESILDAAQAAADKLYDDFGDAMAMEANEVLHPKNTGLNAARYRERIANKEKNQALLMEVTSLSNDIWEKAADLKERKEELSEYIARMGR